MSHAIASNFSIYNKIDNTTAVSFNIGEYSIESLNSFDRIISNSKGRVEEYGSPELPLFSFNYGIEKNKEYSVTYDVLDYVVHQNINVYPSQPYSENSISVIKNENLYQSPQRFPNKNIEYNKLSIRGYELLGIAFIPFEYNFESKELKVYTQVSINITEIEQENNQNTTFPRSEIFENMYKNIKLYLIKKFFIKKKQFRTESQFFNKKFLRINELTQNKVVKIKFGNKNKNKTFFVIKRSPGGGFFSNLLFVLDNLYYCEKKNYIPIIDMENFPTKYNQKKNLGGVKNIWNLYFKP